MWRVSCPSMINRYVQAVALQLLQHRQDLTQRSERRDPGDGLKNQSSTTEGLQEASVSAVRGKHIN